MAKKVKSGKPAMYVARTFISHDGKEYGVGDDIELYENEAAPLLADKAVDEKPSPAAKDAPKT